MPSRSWTALVAEAPAGAPRLACSDGEIEPGAVYAHTHIYSGLASYGMPPPNPPPQTFLQILERVWWRLDRALDAGTLRASARDYVSRALLAGTTTLIDHHESPNFIEGSLAILGEVCEELGVRALLCYGATERNFGRDEGRRGPRRMSPRRLLAAAARPRRAARELHGVRRHDPRCRRLARELGTVVHVHVAEDRPTSTTRARRGAAGPLERLLKLGALPPGSILAHGVHLTRRQFASRPTPAAGSFTTRAPTRATASAMPRALSAAKRVALGTDGWEADMAAEDAALKRLAEANGDRSASRAGLPPGARWSRNVSAPTCSRWPPDR